MLLLLLGRKLSAMGEAQAFQLPDQSPQPAQLATASQILNAGEDRSKPPAIVGSELPFPIPLPELTQDNDGKYNRPEFVNYYFAKIDLVLGPPDRTAILTTGT
ncbi:MAG TPA: hypothetical protein VF938_07525 [Candidatus Angelobacter sp.]